LLSLVRPAFHAALAFTIALAGCGYSAVPAAGARSIAIGRLSEPGIDVDAAALVNAAVRHAIASSPSTRLVSRGAADATLDIELLNSASALAPLADPNVRAAQYRAVVLVRGRLLDKRGVLIWESPVIQGDSPFLSTPGPVETLDGARRRALARAADIAAERLVACLVWR
jgi:lipopolysaccharide assembly LptE-like protein